MFALKAAHTRTPWWGHPQVNRQRAAIQKRIADRQVEVAMRLAKEEEGYQKKLEKEEFQRQVGG